MNDARKVAVVTGGNRGIGLEIGRQLAAAGVRVVLGSRDENDGRAAAAKLTAAGLTVEARALDVTRPATIDALASHLEATYGGLDILVNNAGVAMDGFDADIARRTLDVNYTGVERVTDRLLPLMRPGGRIVMISSGLGETSDLPPKLRDRLHAADLDRAELDGLMRGFVDGVAADTHAREGWPSSAYRVSKMGLNAFTAILGRALARDGRGIVTQAVCPGWVKTRMGGAGAPRSVQEGADTAVWLALLPEGGIQGAVYRDRQPIDW
ncbi:short chain dehydrogenase [Minicystis rosea]|nr:short chain dehydrogenase [Minicystis rosea]